MNLFDWLEAEHEGQSHHGTGLLLAPLGAEQPEEDITPPDRTEDRLPEEPQPPQPDDEPDALRELQQLNEIVSSIEERLPEEPPVETWTQEPEPQQPDALRELQQLNAIVSSIEERLPEEPPAETWTQEPQSPHPDNEPDALRELQQLNAIVSSIEDRLPEEPPAETWTQEPQPQQPDALRELQQLNAIVSSIEERLPEEPPAETWTQEPEPQQPEEPEQSPEAGQSREWQEMHTGFSLSLDEPPPEIWTRIDNPTEADTEDDDEEEYEQGMSLQGDAYVLKQSQHGLNFTQRLQRTLRGRKERAAKLREEEEKTNPHPYRGKAILLCGTAFIALVLSWVCLLFLQHGVAAYLERAKAEQQEQQKQVQPSPSQPEHTEPEKKSEIIVPITPVKPPEPPAVKIAPLLTFDEALTQANHNYNIGMYSQAITLFHRALTLRDDDIRPYIGLARSYRARGMYFDAKRLLDEARAKFGRNPTIEMEQYYLRRE